MNKKFCPKCGYKLNESTKFCPKCGASLISQVAPQPPIPTQSKITRKRQTLKQKRKIKKSHKKLSKKAKVGIGLGMSAVILVGLFYCVGATMYSKEKQVSQIVKALTTKKGDAASVIVAKDPNLKVTKENSKPTHDYFMGISDPATVGESLNSKDKYGHFKLVQDGHNLLLFPKYKLEVPSYKPIVSTNHKNTQVLVNNKNIGTIPESSDDDYSGKIGPLLEGKYDIKVKSKVHGKDLSTKTNKVINSDDPIDLSIKTKSFTIKSIPNGIVYINEEKVGTLDKDGEKTFEDYPVTKGMKMYIAKKVNGKTLKSTVVNNFDEKDTDSEQSLVKPTFTGMIDKDKAADFLLEQFKTDSPDSDAFIGGEDSKAYHLIVDALKKTSEKDGFESISNCKIKVINDELSGDGESTVDFQVFYDFDFDDYTNHQVIEWDGCIIKNEGTSEDPDYKIKSLGKYKMIENNNTRPVDTDEDDDDSDD